MRRFTTQTIQLTSFLLLVVLAVVLGNLAYNLQFVPAQEGSNNPTPIVPTVDEGPGTTALQALTIILGTVSVLAIAGFVVRYIRNRRKNDKELRFRDVASSNNTFLLSMALVVALFAVLFIVRRKGGGFDFGDQGSQGQGTGTTPQNLLPTVSAGSASIPLGVIILLVAVGALIGLNLIRHTRLTRSTVQARPRREAAEEVARTLYDLEAGSDARAAILRCYRNMSEILGRHGVPNVENITPREFRSRAAPVLRIREASLDRLTALFEVARYSQHSVGEPERSEASDCLREIQGELGA